MTSNMGEFNILLIAWHVLVLFAILYQGYLFGKARFPAVTRVVSLPLGAVCFIAVQSILQTGWYYLGWPLSWKSDVATLLIASVCISFAAWRSTIHGHSSSLPAPTSPVSHPHFLPAIPLLATAVSALGFIVIGALLAATTESIRTPWPLLAPYTLLAIAVLWLTLVLSIALVRRLSILCIHAVLAIAGTTFIAPILYRVGFGFDGFLHVASERILLLTGTLSPKPLSYIGQYVFTTWLSRMTDLPIASIDRWLVPVAATIIIPLCLYVVLRTREHDDPSVIPHPSFLVLALLPLAAFVATTPQSFSYVLALSALILLGHESIRQHFAHGHRHPLPALILATWAAAVHPLAGIPVILLVLAASFRQRIISWVLVILAAISVPLLFVVIGQHGATAISWDLSLLTSPSLWLDRLAGFAPWIGNHFVLWPAWASLAEKAVPVVLLVLSFFAIKQKSDYRGRPYIPQLIVAAILLWIAATALKAAGDFAFLIDYERGNYADRLNMLAIFCLIPPASVGIERLTSSLKRAGILPRIALAGFMIFMATGLAYDALPRNDALVVGHGWSVSSQDIEAARSIDQDAYGRRYTVLADQSVSAAAVQQFGFRRYTANNVFYYPIPTGGPLYQVYLDVTYKQPTRDTVHDAAMLGESDLVYVVLNNYWWNAEAVSEELKHIADKSWEIDGGKVRIYKFDFKTPSKAAAATSTR